MSGSRAIYFDGRAISIDMACDDFIDDTAALHLASLASAIEQVSAVAQEIATDTSGPQTPTRLHGLLVAIELMASICSVVAHGIADVGAGE